MNPDPALIGLPSGVSAERAAAQFDQLQRKLVPLWELIESFNQQEQTIVVVPSMSVDVTVTGLEAQGYEERFLFLLLLLAQPRADRKSTRLNSSHQIISYAVFCLKKKT